MFETERARARQICRENTLKAEIAEVDERGRRAEIKGEDHVRFVG